jgi:hypothetical protein
MTLMFDGQVNVGNCVSTTVTVNEQAPGLPEVSVTEQLTVVTPLLNVAPLAGTQVGVTVSQLSVAVAAG